MRKIELKKLTDEDGNLFDYKAAILGQLRYVSDERGIDLDVMEKWLALRRLIRDAMDFVLLEEEDYKALVGCIRQSRWRISDGSLIEFKHDILSAPTVAVEEKASG